MNTRNRTRIISAALAALVPAAAIASPFTVEPTRGYAAIEASETGYATQEQRPEPNMLPYPPAAYAAPRDPAPAYAPAYRSPQYSDSAPAMQAAPQFPPAPYYEPQYPAQSYAPQHPSARTASTQYVPAPYPAPQYPSPQYPTAQYQAPYPGPIAQGAPPPVGYGTGMPAAPAECQTSFNVGTAIGGIAGALLGRTVGRGSGRAASTALGAVVGGVAGTALGDSCRR